MSLHWCCSRLVQEYFPIKKRLEREALPMKTHVKTEHARVPCAEMGIGESDEGKRHGKKRWRPHLFSKWWFVF